MPDYEKIPKDQGGDDADADTDAEESNSGYTCFKRRGAAPKGYLDGPPLSHLAVHFINLIFVCLIWRGIW